MMRTGRLGVRGRAILILTLLSIVFLSLVMRHDERVMLTDSAGAFYASCSRSLAVQTATAIARGDETQVRQQLEMATRAPGVKYAAVLRPSGKVVAAVGAPTTALRDSKLVTRLQGVEIRASKIASMPAEFFVVCPISPGADSSSEVVLYVSSDALATHLRGGGRWRPWSLAAVALAAGLVAFWADRHVSRSTRALLGATHALAEGALDRRVEISTGDLLEQLGADFNSMADRVLAGEEDLRRINVKLNATVSELGLLASGLAHELNNPLAAIAAMVDDLSDLITSDSAPPEEIARRLRAVSAETARSHRLVGELLAYARPADTRTERTAIAPVIRQAIHVARTARDVPGIRLELAIAEDLPEVMGGADAHEQILLNILSNALDASPPGGLIRVGARRDGGGVRIEVSDEGPGIPPDRLDRIFEPFFTTKPAGKGTGLGLAIVDRMVRNLDGRVYPDPTRKGGATFVVQLPAAT